MENYLKNIRKSKNLTQTQLAEKMGCEQQHIQRWESNFSMITFSNLQELAKALDMKINPNLFIENH